MHFCNMEQWDHYLAFAGQKLGSSWAMEECHGGGPDWAHSQAMSDWLSQVCGVVCVKDATVWHCASELGPVRPLGLFVL